METVKKIVVIGPESTGKSTLCKNLAEHYGTLWVPEYARTYLEKSGPRYTYADLLAIAKGQLEQEDTVTSMVQPANGRPVFIDTDLYVMKVWSEFVYNQCPNWILNRIAERRYDGYLLCDTDLPWVEDDLREHPDLRTRQKLYAFYKDLLANQGTPWCSISGNYENRFEKALSFLESTLPKELL